MVIILIKHSYTQTLIKLHDFFCEVSYRHIRENNPSSCEKYPWLNLENVGRRQDGPGTKQENQQKE